jgi:alpha-1,2-mannosyltransferase
LQVKSLKRFLELHPEYRGDVRLLLIGSCRNDSDQKRVDFLKKLVKGLQLQDSVEFSINPPYSQLQQSMYEASIGLHTMRQEHFGIGIVEMMAAGLLTIAHNSGGPKTDIVHPGVSGFLAITVDEFAAAIHQALTLKNPQDMRQKAQESATRFSDQVFDTSLKKLLSQYFV